MAVLPPIPWDKPPQSFEWIDWYVRLRDIIETSALDHQSLLNLQGGNATERYHLTAAEHTALLTLVTDLNETVDDRVAAFLQAGTGISLSYNDAGNQLVISNTSGGGSTTTPWMYDSYEPEPLIIPGPQGNQGTAGSNGATGAQGPIGPPGLAGEDGVDGSPGPPGAPGATGPTGPSGTQGPQGVPGYDGIDGVDGDRGPPGPAGANGTNGSNGLDGLPLFLMPDVPEPDWMPIPGPKGDTGATGAPGAGGSGASGTVELDFGALPGTMYTTVAVTGQASIVAGSLVNVWIRPAATTDHTADEHIVDPPRVIAGDIISATGFTIHGFSTNKVRHHGKYTVAWTWS